MSAVEKGQTVSFRRTETMEGTVAIRISKYGGEHKRSREWLFRPEWIAEAYIAEAICGVSKEISDLEEAK